MTNEIASFAFEGGAADSGEDEVEGAGFLPQDAGFGFQVGNCTGEHSDEEICFTRLFAAGVDFQDELFSRHSIVSLTIVAADARAAAGELIDEPIRVRASRDFFQEINHRLPKLRSPFLQIVSITRTSSILTNNAAFLRVEFVIRPVLFPRLDSIVKIRHAIFVIHSEFVMRHSSFQTVSITVCSVLQNIISPTKNTATQVAALTKRSLCVTTPSPRKA